MPPENKENENATVPGETSQIQPWYYLVFGCFLGLAICAFDLIGALFWWTVTGFYDIGFDYLSSCLQINWVHYASLGVAFGIFVFLLSITTKKFVPFVRLAAVAVGLHFFVFLLFYSFGFLQGPYQPKFMARDLWFYSCVVSIVLAVFSFFSLRPNATMRQD